MSENLKFRIPSTTKEDVEAWKDLLSKHSKLFTDSNGRTIGFRYVFLFCVLLNLPTLYYKHYLLFILDIIITILALPYLIRLLQPFFTLCYKLFLKLFKKDRRVSEDESVAQPSYVDLIFSQTGVHYGVSFVQWDEIVDFYEFDDYYIFQRNLKNSKKSKKIVHIFSKRSVDVDKINLFLSEMHNKYSFNWKKID